MGNCVGDTAAEYNPEDPQWTQPVPGGYYQSLRDPDNIPHVTWNEDDGGDALGRHNSPIGEQYRPYLHQVGVEDYMTRNPCAGCGVNESRRMERGDLCDECAGQMPRQAAAAGLAVLRSLAAAGALPTLIEGPQHRHGDDQGGKGGAVGVPVDTQSYAERATHEPKHRDPEGGWGVAEVPHLVADDPVALVLHQQADDARLDPSRGEVHAAARSVLIAHLAANRNQPASGKAVEELGRVAPATLSDSGLVKHSGHATRLAETQGDEQSVEQTAPVAPPAPSGAQEKWDWNVAPGSA